MDWSEVSLETRRGGKSSSAELDGLDRRQPERQTYVVRQVKPFQQLKGSVVQLLCFVLAEEALEQKAAFAVELCVGQSADRYWGS